MSNRSLPWLFFCCLLVAALSAVAATPASRHLQPPAPDSLDTLREAIDAYIGEPRFNHARWGIEVRSLDTGKLVYSHNGGQLLQPASTAKLFTAALTLNTLGTDHRIPTQLLAGKAIAHGQLNGPLVLYGMGDPTLGTDDASPDWADQLAAQAASVGLRTVRGDLIGDDTYFATPPFGSGWEAIDLQSWFAVPTSALSVRENEYSLLVSAGKTVGAHAQLVVTPQEVQPPLISNIDTSPLHARSDINLYRAPGSDTLYAFGSVPLRSSAQTFRLSMPDPALQAATELASALARHGIRLEGHIRSVHWPHDAALPRTQATVIGQILSPSSNQILHNGLKRSQNLYLQNLLLTDGIQAALKSAPNDSVSAGFMTSEAAGIHALYQLLGQIDIDRDEVRLQEGTGLSRADLVTPDAMTRLLVYLAAQPYADTLRDDLPIAGVDGTLIGRMRDTPAMNNLHAKTGSMSHVHCLAGYVSSAAGERLAFTIMLNDYDAPDDAPSPSRDIDAIAVLLASLRARSQ